MEIEADATVITLRSSDLLTFDQASRLLGVHRATLYRWLARGKLHSIRIDSGDRVYFFTDEVTRLAASLRRRTADPSTPTRG